MLFDLGEAFLEVVVLDLDLGEGDEELLLLLLEALVPHLLLSQVVLQLRDPGLQLSRARCAARGKGLGLLLGLLLELLDLAVLELKLVLLRLKLLLVLYKLLLQTCHLLLQLLIPSCQSIRLLPLPLHFCRCWSSCCAGQADEEHDEQGGDDHVGYILPSQIC